MSTPGWRVGIAVVAIVFGLLAVWAAYGPGHVAEGVPWLASGWICVAAGVVLERSMHRPLAGALLVLAGFAWLLPAPGTCLNVEPLTHRCIDLAVERSLAPVVDGLWCAFLVAAIVASLRRPGGGTPAVPSIVAGIGAAAVIVIALAVAPEVPHALEVGLALAAGLVVAGAFAADAQGISLTPDRLVELGPALAEVLGDPSFGVLVRSSDGDAWRGIDGATAMAAAPPEGVAITQVTRDGVELARIVHHPATLQDPQLRSAVLTAVELAAHNIRLRGDLDLQAEEIAASRRRLVDAGLREQEELSRQVEADVGNRLDDLAAAIGQLHDERSDGPVDARLAAAATSVDAARSVVGDLVRGVYPPALRTRGLIAALRELAGSAPIEVDLHVPSAVPPLAPDIAATLYFVCAEAVVNAARHAGTGSVGIDVDAQDGKVTARVEDAGVGGASLDGGTGLRGLRDRVASMGGTLHVDSPPGTGTRLVVTLLASDEARDFARTVTPPWPSPPSNTR